MKSVYVFVLLAALLALAHAFPGVNRESAESTEVENNDDKLVVVVPSRSNIFDDLGDDDNESGYPFSFPSFKFRNPYEGLFTRMQEAMNRIQSQMINALSNQFANAGLTPWAKVPEGANTTSTTKVIGDHSVTVNETTYTDGDENGGVIFRVRVIDVKPLNETTDNGSAEETATKKVPSEDASPEENDNREELTTPTSRSVETVEEFDNEIHKNQVETLTA